MSDEITFNETLKWADNEITPSKSKSIPLFYLVLGSVVIMVVIILILYLAGRNKKKKRKTTSELKALNMMKDDEHVYNSDDKYETYEEVVTE